MTTYHDLTGFRRDILQAIVAVDSEPYGLALKSWLDERYGDSINHSRLYQNLDRLTEDGLVTRTPIDDRTNAYELTAEGRNVLVAQANALSATCGDLSTADQPVPSTGGDA